MADIFSVTAPLAIRFPDGETQIMIERLPYNDGLLFLPAFWTDKGIDASMQFIPGPIKGDGPWKAGDAVITVLACHGTDAKLAGEFSCWQGQLSQLGDVYPDREEIHKLMKTHAATVADAGTCHPRFRK